MAVRFVPRRSACVLAAFAALAAPVAAGDLALQFPAATQVTRLNDLALGSYDLAVGPFRDGEIAMTHAEGQMQQQAWQVQSDSLTTLDLLQSLRAQIVAAGYAVNFECETQACGGFDFRYGIGVLPEPEMHVDLGDFRYLVASRPGTAGQEYLSLLVSRSPLNGYVQMTRIGGAVAVRPAVGTDLPAARFTASSKAPDGVAAPLAGDIAAEAGSEQAQLAMGLPVVLGDLAFASGAATLQAEDVASLDRLAAWLHANPDKTVILVGHTDASGGLAANISLSKRRAEAVRQVLLRGHDIPAAQVSADGVGPLAPRASNLDPDGQAQNRRVEVFVTSTR